jgi:hypothetical protein
MINTGISPEIRKELICEAFWALINREPRNLEGFDSFVSFARTVAIDAKPVKYKGSYTSEDYAKIRNQDGNINWSSSYNYVKTLQYLKKNHKDIYENLKPWLEPTND